MFVMSFERAAVRMATVGLITVALAMLVLMSMLMLTVRMAMFVKTVLTAAVAG
jgi:hypothetical protein